MTRVQITKTSFTSGEIDPEMHGRIDLRAYQDGAARLRNVVVRPTGGVARRPGTRYVADAGVAERLIALDTRNGERLVLIGSDQIVVRDSQSVIQTAIPSYWTKEQLSQIAWTQIDEGLLICHEDVAPRRLVLDLNGEWALSTWRFEELDNENGSWTAQPYAKVADSQAAIQPTNINVANPNEADPIAAGSDIRILATEPLFLADHFGVIFRIKGREVRIQSVISSTEARAIVLQDLVDGKSTRFFEEQLFSEARGWPAAVARHQDRLVLGGCPGAPEQIWFSKTGDYFNFDLGTGLDDEAIGFRLSDNRSHRIRQMAGGRHLQVLTNAGEWVVSGNPLTPSNIQLDLQTNVGSPADRQIPPLEVDGARLFVGASKRDVREFLFADTEQAFQAPDIALLSRHLIRDPREMAFLLEDRLLAIALDSGEVATATLDRNANIIAWTAQDFGGAVLALALFDSALHMIIERDGQRAIEVLSKQTLLDAAVEGESDQPQSLWSGFAHLTGKVVRVIADSVDLGEYLITGDELDLGSQASKVVAGLTFEHQIEPLPVSGVGERAPLDALYRPIRSVFRVHESQNLRIQTNRGEKEILAELEPMSGDYALRDFGWRRGLGEWPWRIRQSDAAPFTLLSATTEIKVNN